MVAERIEDDAHRDGRASLRGLGANIETLWDRWGIPHVFAGSVEDAFAGLGYASAHDRLWQIEIGRLYSTGRAASVLGPRLLRNDILMRAIVNPTDQAIPESPGDNLVDAYLAGVNGYIDDLDEVPPEFLHAGIEPSHITSDEVAAKHRFSGWFQFNHWVNKITIARLMAEHGVNRWRNHLIRFSDEDEALFNDMAPVYAGLNPDAARLVFAAAGGRAGSNNWAVSGEHTASGKPVLASDPHLQFGIPGTFYISHLSAPDFDLVGASFPGGPFFPIGHTRNVAWGITTGMIDNSDIYVEELDEEDGSSYRTPDGWADLEVHEDTIDVKGEDSVAIRVERTRHGPLLDPLMALLDLGEPTGKYRMALRWSVGAHATSAGALARLPLARDVNEHHDYVFEDGITPTVYNMCAADRSGNIRRWIAGNFARHEGVTGVLPFPGWDSKYDFDFVKGDELIVEDNPASGFVATANNDTMEMQRGYPVHNFAVGSQRINRLREELGGTDGITVADTKRLQLDLLDTGARDSIPAILELIGGSTDERVVRGAALLDEWDCRATPGSAGACVYYAMQAKAWHHDFLKRALEAEGENIDLLRYLPASGGIAFFGVHDLLGRSRDTWGAHEGLLRDTVANALGEVVEELETLLGDDPEGWRWAEIHQVSFEHTLAKRNDAFAHLKIGPEPVGGARATLAMANFMGRTAPFRSHHGPVFRMVVDLADVTHPQFVIAGGNSSRPDSSHTMDLFPLWLSGDYITIPLEREEVERRTLAEWRIDRA